MGKINSYAVFLVLQLTLSAVNGANIMFFSGISSYSHRIAVWPLTEALASLGHSITFVSPFASKTPNPKVYDYVPTSLEEWMKSWDETETFHERRLSGQIDYEWYKLVDYGTGVCQTVMDDPKFIHFLNSTKFDLLIVDSLMNECAYGIAHKYKAKVIVYNTANPFPWYVDPFGFPDESSWIPDFVFHYPIVQNNYFKSFYQRMVALLNPLYFYYLRQQVFFPKLEQILRAKLDPDMPPISELESNVNLLFINHHYAEDYPRPLPPNVISVPGMHCKKADKLPKDVEDFLKGDEGFLYMSFGSYAELSHFPNETQKVLIDTLKELKNIKVVWKMNMDLEEELPKHIYTSKWMPQQDILGHEKIKGFITHGGLLGIQEAIYHKVPLIAFPIFAEQDYNAEKLEWRHVGKKLEISRVTKGMFRTAIYDLLGDERYKKNMEKLSKRFLDRETSPVDSAVWWTEYVLRHDDEDLKALRPMSIYQSWWKKRQLDIWAVLFLSVLICMKVVWFVMKGIMELFLGKSNPKLDKKKKAE